MNPVGKTDTEVDEETSFDDYDEELERDVAGIEELPEYKALAHTREDIQRMLADHKAGRLKTIPWSEVEAAANAISAT
jgi:hypothetical protein